MEHSIIIREKGRDNVFPVLEQLLDGRLTIACIWGYTRKRAITSISSSTPNPGMSGTCTKPFTGLSGSVIT